MDRIEVTPENTSPASGAHERPHLFDAEIAEIIVRTDSPEIDDTLRAHLEVCDLCLVRISDRCEELAIHDDANAGLRAVNLAAARWKSEIAAAGKVERDLKDAVLLGRLGVENSGTTGAVIEDAGPVLTLFLGKSQTKG